MSAPAICELWLAELNYMFTTPAWKGYLADVRRENARELAKGLVELTPKESKNGQFGA